MNATSTMVGQPASYEVNANSNRSFHSSRKSEVMSVAKAWMKAGFAPQVYAIGEDAEGRVTCDRVAIK
jgi:hypothetical protein